MQTTAHLPHSDLCTFISDCHFMLDLFAKTRREICFVTCMTIAIFKIQFLHYSLKKTKNKLNFNPINTCYLFTCSIAARMWNVCPLNVFTEESQLEAAMYWVRSNSGSAAENREYWILMNVSPHWYNINYIFAPICFQSVQTFTLQ